MATREESLAYMQQWLASLRGDLSTIQKMLEPIARGWALETFGGNTIPMTSQQRLDHINAGLVVLQRFQTTAATLPDVSGFSEP